MLLCEDTIGEYPTHLLRGNKRDEVKRTGITINQNKVELIDSDLPPAVLAKVGSLEIPKNKNARRRLARQIMSNVDKINKAKEFKSKGRALRSDMSKAIRQVAK